MLKFIMIFIILFLSVSAQNCVPVDLGSTTIVCQCNATYCDYYPDPESPGKNQFIWYVTSKSGKRLSRSDGKISNAPLNVIKVTIDSGLQYQSIKGFGGAFTDAAGINIKKLSPGCQDHIMRSYFSSNGLNYNLARVPIAGADFSTRPYTYDDTPGDTDLNLFSLADDDYAYKLPYMKKALDINPSLKFQASPWTAPPWMKKHNSYTSFDYLMKQYYQVYANYLLKFIQEYKKNGFDIWMISAGNHPYAPLVPGFNLIKMYWSPEDEADWIINNLGPTLKNSPFNSTQILLYEDQRHALGFYVAKILYLKPKAMDYSSGIAVHWYSDYMDNLFYINVTHHIAPSKYLIMTESSLAGWPYELPKVDLGSWYRAEHLAIKMFENLNNWFVGWIDWNLVLDKQGGPNWLKNFNDAFIIIDPDKDVFYKQPYFYTFGHFSKFVPRSSVRVNSSSTDESILSTAFQTTDKKLVVLLYNMNNNKKNVTITDKKIGNINIELPESSIHTILYKYQ